jgi:hypothetical protein
MEIMADDEKHSFSVYHVFMFSSVPSQFMGLVWCAKVDLCSGHWRHTVLKHLQLSYGDESPRSLVSVTDVALLTG